MHTRTPQTGGIFSRRILRERRFNTLAHKESTLSSTYWGKVVPYVKTLGTYYVLLLGSGAQK